MPSASQGLVTESAKRSPQRVCLLAHSDPDLYPASIDVLTAECLPDFPLKDLSTMSFNASTAQAMMGDRLDSRRECGIRVRLHLALRQVMAQLIIATASSDSTIEQPCPSLTTMKKWTQRLCTDTPQHIRIVIFCNQSLVWVQTRVTWTQVNPGFGRVYWCLLGWPGYGTSISVCLCLGLN